MRLRPSLAFALSPLLCAQQPAPATLRIPAFSGYAHPRPDAVRRDTERGTVPECRGELHFYVENVVVGALSVRLMRAAGASAPLELRCASHPGETFATLTAQPNDDDGEVTFGTLAAPRPGTLRLELRTSDGSPLRNVEALLLDGPAVARASTLAVERRNASSVHLVYDTPDGHADDVEWFACELEPKSDPLWTYYMATGWHRGYFGMQVNSPTERRIIFSVWDSGDEAVDRDKVAAADRVQLVRKGDGVVAEDFGNEGTGGHSHLVHDWRLGDRIRFLVHAEPDGTHTTYTGWFVHVRDGAPLGGDGWRLVASFRAPKDGRYLHGMYSFSENFSGANGDALRECEFGPVWQRSHGGDWFVVRQAKFSHDGHGKRHRLDRAGGVRGQRFFLRHGDYATASTPYGTRMTLPDVTSDEAHAHGIRPPRLPQ